MKPLILVGLGFPLCERSDLVSQVEGRGISVVSAAATEPNLKPSLPRPPKVLNRARFKAKSR